MLTPRLSAASRRLYRNFSMGILIRLFLQAGISSPRTTTAPGGMIGLDFGFNGGRELQEVHYFDLASRSSIQDSAAQTPLDSLNRLP